MSKKRVDEIIHCSKCDIEFFRKATNKGRVCNECKKADARARHKLTPERNAYKRQYAKDKLAVVQNAVIQYKKNHPCVDCGETRIPTLQFDHRDPATKITAVGVLVRDMKPMEEVFAEIAKCDVRCANCHAVKTAEQLGWYEGIDISLD